MRIYLPTKNISNENAQKCAKPKKAGGGNKKPQADFAIIAAKNLNSKN